MIGRNVTDDCEMYERDETSHAGLVFLVSLRPKKRQSGLQHVLGATSSVFTGSGEAVIAEETVSATALFQQVSLPEPRLPALSIQFHSPSDPFGVATIFFGDEVVLRNRKSQDESGRLNSLP